MLEMMVVHVGYRTNLNLQGTTGAQGSNGTTRFNPGAIKDQKEQQGDKGAIGPLGPTR